MNENLDIFLYSHKPFTPIVQNPTYKILTGCHEDFPTTMPVYRDYTGDNISDMNLMYNEYCGFYWLWKNYELKDYVGMNHYRRYYEFLDNIPNMDDVFKNHSIVLNEPLRLQLPNSKKVMNNRTWYDFWHNVEDFDFLTEIIHDDYPEYRTGLERMERAHYIYNSSLFIMKKDMFKEYCDFVFSVLDTYRKEMGFETTQNAIEWVTANQEKYIKPHLPYYTIEMQSRIVGYVAERVLNTFLMNGNHPIERDAKKYNIIMT